MSQQPQSGERGASLLRLLWEDNKRWLVPTLLLIWIFLLGFDLGRFTS